MPSKNISSHVNLSHCRLCQGDTEYYCLTCETNLCPACKTNHSINPDTKEHDTRLYKYKNTIPRTREPCRNHPSQDYEMYCDVCAIPFCVDCEEHKEHSNREVMTVYKEHEEIIDNKRNTLYNCQVLLTIIKQDITTCNNKLAFFLSDMTRELQKVKDQLDAVSIAAYIKLNLHRITQNQTTAMNKHLSKIKEVDTIQHMFAHKRVKFLRFMKKAPFTHMNMTPVRVQHCLFSTTKMDFRDLPIFRNEITHTERGKRHMRRRDLLRLMAVPELQKSSTFKTFTSCEHISCVTREKIWISERNKLFLIDITTGSILHTINYIVDGWWWGLHTVSIDRDLFFISNDNRIIKLSSDRKTAKTVYDSKNFPVQLRCLYCSPFTDDLVIGMKFLSSINFGVVGRLGKNGQFEITLPEGCRYKDPNYITESNNGDIVVADYWLGVVVIDHRGKHRFTYTETPFGSRLLPRGICTDALSNILVCDCYTGKVLILDKEGKYLLNIPTDISLGPLGKPCSLSYDWNTHTLWVGSWNNTVSRYRHIDRRFVLTDNGEICTAYNSEVSRCLNNPWHLPGFDPVVSAFRRGFVKILKLEEEPTLHEGTFAGYMIKFLSELYEELFKAITLRALKYHISMDEAALDLGKWFILKAMSVLYAFLVDIIIETLRQTENDDIIILLLEIEGYLLKVGQKVYNMNLKHVMKRILEDNDTFIKVKELLRERMETFEKTMNKLKEKEFRDQAKDIFHLVMDVLSIFNQAEELTEFQQAAEKE